MDFLQLVSGYSGNNGRKMQKGIDFHGGYKGYGPTHNHCNHCNHRHIVTTVTIITL
jgi:hypothetical protein